MVLDSSATLAWIYSEEITEAIRQLFDAVADNGAIVPALWRLEVANSLTVAVRRAASTQTSAAPLWPILRSWTSPPTRTRIPSPGAKR
jgi:predicted nucleic acid-binding protein